MTLRSRILFAWLLLLTGCAGVADFTPVNKPGSSVHELRLGSGTNIANKPDHDTLVALSFSGGGMRASAFSYGVLKSFSAIPLKSSEQKNIIDAVDFISGVSGGSVTAAYFALKGPQGYDDFRQKFLDKNAEAGLRSDVSISNVVRILSFGGVNDRQNMPIWLDDNLFHGATYAQVFAKERPILWVGASDIFNRTPFVFSATTFAPLCSDLSQVRLADAVSASAAVPAAFTPVNLESFAEQCTWHEPAWSTNNDLYFSQVAALESLRRYHDPKAIKYVKLMDGGLTDNFGVSGITLARISQGNAYAPMSKKRAMRIKRVLFVVANSGRGTVDGEWNLKAENPSVFALASAVTDTAIDANTRTTYDFFKIVMDKWNQDLIRWRCSLSKSEVYETLGEDSKNWKCDDIHFFVTQVSFADAGAEREKRLDNIPTRFVLPNEDIDFLIESADIAVKNNRTFNNFLKDLQ